MSTKEIIQNIKRLPFNQCLLVMEKTLMTLHESADSEMEKAAKALLKNYKTDKNLTTFTAT